MNEVLVPYYFNDFHCKCGKCRFPCCSGWRININEKEYFHLISLYCSKKLRENIDDALVLSKIATKESYAYLEPNYINLCPMLDSDGLCRLQKEKGEKTLPLICRMYPRALKKYGNHYEMVMSCSCEETIELLIKDENPFYLTKVNIELPFDGLKIYDENGQKDNTRYQIIEIMNQSKSIIEGLNKISNYLNLKGEYISFKKDKALKSIKNLIHLLCEISNGIKEVAFDIDLFLTGIDNNALIDEFEKDEKHLLTIMPNAELFAIKAICNHMFYESFPYVQDVDSIDTAFSALVTAIALLKIIAVFKMKDTKDINKFVDPLSFANRFIEHSNFYKLCSQMDHPKGKETLSKFSKII